MTAESSLRAQPLKNLAAATLQTRWYKMRGEECSLVLQTMHSTTCSRCQSNLPSGVELPSARVCLFLLLIEGEKICCETDRHLKKCGSIAFLADKALGQRTYFISAIPQEELKTWANLAGQPKRQPLRQACKNTLGGPGSCSRMDST